jgi:hypothetical protein
MTRNFEQHSTEESLELYALGQLDDEKSELLEEHLLICEDCCARLDTADRYVRAMRSGAARLRREEKSKSRASHARTAIDWFRMPLPAWGAAVLTTTQIHRTVPTDSPVAATLIAERGEAASFPAHRRLNLTLDANGLKLGPKTKVELVDANGKVIEEDTVSAANHAIKTTTREGLDAGAYYVRLYAPGASDPLREYSLAVK